MRSSAVIASAARRLGVQSEARTLLAHVLGAEPGTLALIPEVSDADAAALDALVARRLAGEPLQHLTGRAFFRSIEVLVGPGVFIPRPETELLAGWALARLREHPSAPGRRRPTVVELCAGSGAISKALAAEFPAGEYHAVELSDAAWPYLISNLTETGVLPVHADMADALPELNGTVDLVVVNPPYVPDGARAELPADVLRDPAMALFSGADGLDALRVVAEVGRRLLRPGGWLGAEHDDSHGLAGPRLLQEAGFVDVTDHVDLAGRPRYVTAAAPDLAG